MTHKILCAIDGTPHAIPAVDLACELSMRLAVPLTICTVNVLTGGMRGPTVYQKDDSAVLKVLDAAVSSCKGKGHTRVDSQLLHARDVAVAIVQFADENGFDHIVTGTGDKGSVTRFALGSVATDVVHRAHCPVTVAR